MTSESIRRCAGGCTGRVIVACMLVWSAYSRVNSSMQWRYVYPTWRVGSLDGIPDAAERARAVILAIEVSIAILLLFKHPVVGVVIMILLVGAGSIVALLAIEARSMDLYVLLPGGGIELVPDDYRGGITAAALCYLLVFTFTWRSR